MFHRITVTLTFLLVLLLAACAGTTFFIVKGWLLPAIACGVAVAGAVISFYRLYSRNGRKIAFLFDAIENEDYSIKFSSATFSRSDRLVNASLDRIKNLIARAKSEIAAKEKYYELIMNSVSTGIIVVDEKDYVFQTNREALRLLGLTVFTHISQLARVDESLARLLKQARPGDKLHVSFTHKKGAVTTLAVRVSEVIIHHDRLRLITVNDINHELDEKEIESWMRLIRVLTHEIMNSITPVTSLSDTLLDLHRNADPEIRNGLELISSTGKNLTSFVESYRAFTRIPDPRPGLFYVEKFVERMIGLSRHQDNAARVVFQVDVQPTDLIIYADETLISQVILNLLKNAVQAIGDREDGLISIKARCTTDEEVVIEISNNGTPIPPDIASQIFIPFFTTKEGGSGIGLSISRQIMQLSGGSLVLKPAASPFTTFMLTFK